MKSPQVLGAVDVLLVENSPANISLFHLAVEACERPMTLHVTTNGEEAIQFLSRRGHYSQAVRPDLVVLDLYLPKVDGFSVLKFIRQDPNLCNLPVTILTSSESDVDLFKAALIGVDKYHFKPNSIKEYFGMVGSVVEETKVGTRHGLRA
jgi:two-component system, chemotaxis family, response regulator Rcp1